MTESGGGTKRMEVSKTEILRLLGELANEFSLGACQKHLEHGEGLFSCPNELTLYVSLTWEI